MLDTAGHVFCGALSRDLCFLGYKVNKVVNVENVSAREYARDLGLSVLVDSRAASHSVK